VLPKIGAGEKGKGGTGASAQNNSMRHIHQGVGQTAVEVLAQPIFRGRRHVHSCLWVIYEFFIFAARYYDNNQIELTRTEISVSTGIETK